ncbi:hypothetical protein DRP04_02790 [Archaeoglobales archaeon]|nr:MAG: hypothetical protein DRP04_02790 [Archaeoglobales archaeon]
MLSSKIKAVFGDLAVDKRIASKSEFTMLPRYVIAFNTKRELRQSELKIIMDVAVEYRKE